MARVRARRTANRGDTPLSPPRQTSDSQPSSPATRRSTRSKSVDTITTPAKAKKTEKHLPVVQEEVVTQVASKQHSVDPPSEHQEDDAEELNADDFDASSGVDTAYDLEAQLEGLDRDLIIDSLPSLFRESSNILSLFRPEALPGLLEDIRSSSTTVGKRFANFQARFDVTSQPCRNDNFLVVDVILHKLADSPNYGQGPWRPDAILYLANLSIFVSAIVAGDDRRITSTLDLMYNNFPGPYLLGALRESDKDTNIYGTALVDATIELAIAIRTEFFISAASDRVGLPSFDPDNVLKQTFFEDEGELRGFEELTDTVVIHKVETACVQRIEAIRKYFSKNSKRPIDVQGIRRKFPRSQFLISVINWASKRRSELDTHVTAQGGLEAITERLTVNELDSFQNHQTKVVDRSISALRDSAPGQTPVSKLQTGLSSSKLSMSAKMQKFKAIKARQAASEDESSSEEGSEDESPEEEEVAQSPNRAVEPVDNGTITLADDDDDNSRPQKQGGNPSPPRPTQLSIVPTQETAKVLAVAKRQAVQSNKENIDTTKRFVDRQAGAKRVDWDESQDNGKRRLDEALTNNNDDDSDNFEIDTRPIKRSRGNNTARDARTQPHHGSDHNAGSVEKAHQAEQRNSRPPPSTQPEAPRVPLQVHRENLTGNRRPLPSSAPERRPTNDSQSPPRPTQTQRVNAEAKVNVRRFNDFSGPKAPQVRRAWGVEEVERLMDFVAIYGTGWSTMMDEDKDHPDGPRLQGRDQVGLKDKARNIKMDFLKACRPLPQGFASVSMKASDLRKLDALGIPRLDGQGGRFIQGDEE